MDEILWKSVPGYEGHYEASNTGLLRSVPNRVVMKNASSQKRILPEKILKATLGKDGRERIVFTVNGVHKWDLLSRIIAMVWVDGYDPKLTVNHKNGNKLDNRPENLEWISREDNIRHGYNTGLYRNRQIYITLTNVSNGEVLKFHSLSEASRYFGKCVGYFSNMIRKRELRELRILGGNQDGNQTNR